MALEKPIIKADVAANSTFEYKPRDIAVGSTQAARSFVNEDSFRSNDFKISELVAQQAGISQLESEAHQDKINNQVLEKLGEVQERAYKEGYDLGLIEGTEKAFQESKSELAEKIRALESLLKRIEDLKGQIFVDNEAELIRLVFLVAKKMALRDLEGNREAILEILQNVIGETQADQKIAVRLSHEDLLFIESLQEKSGSKIEALQRVKFYSEDGIRSGGCLIETEYGNVDATIEERLERTWQTMAARIPQKAQKKE